MTTTWILTANASEAHLYSIPRAKLLNGEAQLSLVGDYGHPESRMKSGDLIAGKSGKFHRRQSGYGTLVESSDAKVLESERFAKELTQCLEEACNQHCFEDLILVAAPGFHGTLNKQIKNSIINQTVSVDIDKDYTKMKPQQIVSLLQAYL